MTGLPPDVFEMYILRPGGAFRSPHRFASDPQAKDRYWLVLNLRPQEDEELVLVTPTTKVERRREARGRWGRDALVDLTPEEYPALEQACVVDCNSLVVWSRDELRRRVVGNEVQYLDPLPDPVLSRLRTAVASARQVPARIKRLVIREEE